MNRQAIKNTAICRYDAKENLYIVESSLLEICTGIAETEDEACEIFDDMLSAMYIEYLEGKRVGQYAKRGRPAKNRVKINVEIKPDTRNGIKAMASKIGCSQGEAADYLYAFWLATNTGKSSKATKAKTHQASKRSVKAV